MFRRIAFFLVLPACASLISLSQSASTPMKDPTAVQLAESVLSAMTPNSALNDITLSAQVSHPTASETESGEATLKALSSGQASLAYSVGGEQHAEIINPSFYPRGGWAGADGVWHQMAIHNTWTPAAWFAPGILLVQVLSDSQLALENLGATNLNGQAAQHLRAWRVLPSVSGSPSDLALIQSLSTVDIYVDATTNLPTEFDFNLHPDSNAGVNIPIAVRYSNWQRSSGVLLPFHIERFWNGSLLDDISVSSVAINSGLSSSSFSVPNNAGGAQ
jgi:hypothetical protein